MNIAAQAPDTSRKSRSSKTWYSQLWVWVFIAMVAGVVLGAAYPQAGAAMQPLGDIFIKLIHMLIAPIIFCTVVHGIAHMADMARVGRVAIKAIVYFEILTSIALIVGLTAVNMLHPGAGMNVDVSKLNAGLVAPYIKQTSVVGFMPFLMSILPNTFVGAFADGNILQVLFLSILCGFSLVLLGETGRPLANVIEAGAKMIFGVVNFIMWVAPIGAFGAIAFTVGQFGVASLKSLGMLLIDFYAVCLVFIFVVFGAVGLLFRFSLPKLLRYLWEEILVCIATTSSETVLPRLMSKMEAAGCDSGVVGLVIPTGYSFNLDGTCLYLATASVFLAQATNTHLSLEEQISLLLILLLTSKGAAGIAGAAFIVLAATLSAHQVIPVASVALVLGIHRLMSQALTPTNYIGNAVATIVVAKWENAVDENKLRATLDGRPANSSPAVV